MLPLRTLNLTWTIRTLSSLHLPAIGFASGVCRAGSGEAGGSYDYLYVDDHYPEEFSDTESGSDQAKYLKK